MKPSKYFTWTMTIVLMLMLNVVPFIYYRQARAHSKRLRVVTEGKMYRSGCLTADGFRDAVHRHGIRTIINLRDEAPNPELPRTYFDHHHKISESELCKELNVKFVFIELDLVPRSKWPHEKPKAIDQYLKVLDDPNNYPVLIHCQAGLHRTGVFAAIYRMEFDGWSTEQAMRELRDHGFGIYFATSANDLIDEYVLSYHPRGRHANAGRVPGPFLGFAVGELNENATGQVIRREATAKIPSLLPASGTETQVPKNVGRIYPSVNLDNTITTVHVPFCKNKTMRRGIEFDLTRALIREISAKTPLRIVDSADGADSELACTLVQRKVIINQNQLGEGREAQWTLSVEFVWRDMRPGHVGKTLLASGNRDIPDRKGNQSEARPVIVNASGSFAPEGGSNSVSQLQTIIDQLAQQIVSRIEFTPRGTPIP